MEMTPVERQRLDFEAKLVAKYFPEFRFLEQEGKTTVEGWIQTNSGKRYKLQIPISGGYPFQKPPMYVTDPVMLPRLGGKGTINSMGSSHAMHVLSNGPGGLVSICHTPSWNPARSCVQILLKGRIWCELYEEHLQTGESIDSLLKSYPARLCREKVA